MRYGYLLAGGKLSCYAFGLLIMNNTAEELNQLINEDY